ncbi:hypothetical protein QQF64_007313 [Cirrhinus molitorella]|uniref:Uncharacterized protein n=1 Tax=Cirrhinus molitorella TaxID=172907 RepID=A0ABR3MA97_9TELE
MTSHLKSAASDKTKTQRCHYNQRICFQRLQSGCVLRKHAAPRSLASPLPDVTPERASIDASEYSDSASSTVRNTERGSALSQAIREKRQQIMECD